MSGHPPEKEPESKRKTAGKTAAISVIDKRAFRVYNAQRFGKTHGEEQEYARQRSTERGRRLKVPLGARGRSARSARCEGSRVPPPTEGFGFCVRSALARARAKERRAAQAASRASGCVREGFGCPGPVDRGEFRWYRGFCRPEAMLRGGFCFPRSAMARRKKMASESLSVEVD